MATTRINPRRDIPRVNWFWGVLLVVAVTFLGVFVPVAALHLFGGDIDWSVGVMAAGFLTAWGAFIATLRIGQWRAWWG
jgi:hypothetical protein